MTPMYICHLNTFCFSSIELLNLPIYQTLGYSLRIIFIQAFRQIIDKKQKFEKRNFQAFSILSI